MCHSRCIFYMAQCTTHIDWWFYFFFILKILFLPKKIQVVLSRLLQAHEFRLALMILTSHLLIAFVQLFHEFRSLHRVEEAGTDTGIQPGILHPDHRSVIFRSDSLGVLALCPVEGHGLRYRQCQGKNGLCQDSASWLQRQSKQQSAILRCVLVISSVRINDVFYC